MKRVLFVYRTPRRKILQEWENAKGPDSLLFGANHLKKLGYQVDFFDSAYSPLNIFHPLFYPFEHSIINVSGMGFKLDQAAYLYPKFNNYDVIIATGDSAGLPILFLKYLKLINKPVIYMTSGLAGAIRGKTNTWVGKFYKKILRNTDIFISYSRVEIEFFKKEMGIIKKIKYIPLATDWNYFSQKSKVTKSTICAVGTESGRDYKTFFKAIEKLPISVEVACHPDNIKGLKIPPNVKIHLNIPVEEVLKIYQRSIISVVCCTERYRSSGQMVFLESAAAGLPIIASKIQGLTTAFNVIDKKHLLYVEPENVSDLKEKISFLINNPHMRKALGANASSYVKVNCTTKHLASKLANYFDKL